MRTFIAVDLSEEQKEGLYTLQKELKKEFNNVKWVNHSNLHVTLKFIGETEEEDAERFSEIVQKAVRGFAPFEMSLNELGFFPGPHKPRIIWVGVDKGKEELQKIWKEVELAFQEEGFPLSDKNFKPHVTIGRIRRVQKKVPAQKWINEHSAYDLSPYLVDNITVYRSDLQPQGAVYTPIDRVYLAKV